MWQDTSIPEHATQNISRISNCTRKEWSIPWALVYTRPDWSSPNFSNPSLLPLFISFWFYFVTWYKSRSKYTKSCGLMLQSTDEFYIALDEKSFFSSQIPCIHVQTHQFQWQLLNYLAEFHYVFLTLNVLQLHCFRTIRMPLEAEGMLCIFFNSHWEI